MIAQRGETVVRFGAFLTRQPESLGHTDDPRDVFRAGPATTLLAAPRDERPPGSAATHMERSHAFGPVKLVSRDAEEIDGHGAQIDGESTSCLDRVNMKYHASLTCDSRY